MSAATTQQGSIVSSLHRFIVDQGSPWTHNRRCTPTNNHVKTSSPHRLNAVTTALQRRKYLVMRRLERGRASRLGAERIVGYAVGPHKFYRSYDLVNGFPLVASALPCAYSQAFTGNDPTGRPDPKLIPRH
jgi:hypothetical protein